MPLEDQIKKLMGQQSSPEKEVVFTLFASH